VKLNDPFLNDYLRQAEIVEKVDLTGEIVGILMRSGRKRLLIMNYPYLMLCCRRGEGEILFSVNLEVSFFGTCYIGVDRGDCHYTLVPADEEMQYEEFKKKAVEIARNVLAGELCADADPEGAFFE